MKWCRLCTWKCNNLSKKMLEFIIRHAFGEELIVSQIYDKFKIVNSELKSNDWQQFQRREGGDTRKCKLHKTPCTLRKVKLRAHMQAHTLTASKYC